MVTPMQKFVNIVAFVILMNSLNYMKGLAAKFQKHGLEVHEAYKTVEDVISSIQRVLSTIDDMFINWYDECTVLADVVGSTKERPRTTHQRHRSNVDAATTAEYYKTAFPMLFLDHLLQNLQDRFSNENRAVVSVCSIIPVIVVSEQDLQGLAGQQKLYEPDLPLAASLVNELRRWRFFWIQKKQAGTTIPDTMKSTLGYADEDCFPNIRILLILGCTLPITSAEAERSFSLLGRLKTHLRSRNDRGQTIVLGTNVHAP